MTNHCVYSFDDSGLLLIEVLQKTSKSCYFTVGGSMVRWLLNGFNGFFSRECVCVEHNILLDIQFSFFSQLVTEIISLKSGK